MPRFMESWRVQGKYVIKEVFGKYKKNIMDRGVVDPPIPLEEIIPFVKEKAAIVTKKHQQQQQQQQQIPQALGQMDDSSEVQCKKGSSSWLLCPANSLCSCCSCSVLFLLPTAILLAESAQVCLARELCERGKVTLVPDRKAFVVENKVGRKYCVTLFPKETCACPSTSTCYHIIAARFSVGMMDIKTKGRQNMAGMFNRQRKRQDRNPGKKAPKKRDHAKTTQESKLEFPENDENVQPPLKKRGRYNSVYDPGTTSPVKNSSDSKAPSLPPESHLMLDARMVEDEVSYLVPVECNPMVPMADSPIQPVAPMPVECNPMVPMADSPIQPVVSDFVNEQEDGLRGIESKGKASIEQDENVEPTYCSCKKPFSGRMVACDNPACAVEWFHYKCVGVRRKPKNHWYCPQCRYGKSNAPEPEFLASVIGQPKQFEFVPVSKAWMVEQSAKLNLTCHGTMRKKQQKLVGKTIFDSPPKNTKRIVGDGNCLFRTLSHVVTNTEDNHQHIRQRICDQIEKNPHRYIGAETAVDYLAKSQMREATSWGTDVELRAAADFLQTVIRVYSPQGDRSIWVTFSPETKSYDESIFIVNRNSHFEPLYRW